MRDPKTSPHNLRSTSEREVVKRARRRSTEERNSGERELRFADLKLLVEQAPIGSIQAYARRLRKPSKT